MMPVINVVELRSTPGYHNSEGKVEEAVGSILGEAYAPGANAFNELLAA